MNAVAIQYIWQAIQDSERSDDLSFIDTLKQSLMPRADRIDRPSASNRAPMTMATEPLRAQQDTLRTPHDTLRTLTLPRLSQP
jgi:hypothetical protein